MAKEKAELSKSICVVYKSWLSTLISLPRSSFNDRSIYCKLTRSQNSPKRRFVDICRICIQKTHLILVDDDEFRVYFKLKQIFRNNLGFMSAAILGTSATVREIYEARKNSAGSLSDAKYRLEKLFIPPISHTYHALWLNPLVRNDLLNYFSLSWPKMYIFNDFSPMKIFGTHSLRMRKLF